MKQNHWVLAFVLFFTAILTCSCSDDKISTSSSDKLSFSAETVSFDTVFSTITSVTAKIKVYNHNSDAVNISSISLGGGSNSNFKINVSGRTSSSQSFSDIELRAKDSMYIFVNITVNPTSQNSPVLIKDSIRFTINGNQQYVNLAAYGQDVIILRNKNITTDTTLTGEKPFLIYGNLTVAQGKTLTVTQGCKLYFHYNAEVVINGNLNAVGTLDKPIVFRGDRMDYLFEGVPYDTLSGQWKGIRLNSPTGVHNMEYVTIKSAKTGIAITGSSSATPQLTIKNSTIHNMDSCGIMAQNANITAINNQISNCAQNCIYLLGGSYNFIHCTIAGYYPTVGRKDVAVQIRNYDSSNALYPISEANFKNCIIFGSYSNEVSLKNNTNATFGVNFFNCLIAGSSSTDSYYTNTVWGNYTQTVFVNTLTYPYNFKLHQSSPAINTADMTVANLYPTDKNGVSRVADEKADIGAYEYVP
ncbi:MAG: right-handed parallel beta-helix repeat-containing protein [Paludibacteraceae bacterium]|nr:right-handed parallel beta-helix repeat-containing protein [Paludibacteraceae bacterium]